jgi:hypothetical protein
VLETIGVAGGLFMGLAVMLALIDAAGKLGRLADAAEERNRLLDSDLWAWGRQAAMDPHEAPTREMAAGRDGRG